MRKGIARDNLQCLSSTGSFFQEEGEHCGVSRELDSNCRFAEQHILEFRFIPS